MQGDKVDRRAGEKGRGPTAVRRTVQASIVQAMREIAAAGGVPYPAEIARRLGKHPSNVHRELRSLMARGRVVKGPRAGRIVPYYLREMG